MEQKYLKDFVISMVVILIIAFAIKDYYLYQKIRTVPVESKYKKLALSEKLLKQIQNIETSIQDRKKFVFTVTKDPLEQNLIVKTKRDLEKQWRKKVENMVRLESTILPQDGNNRAAISYDGKTKIYKVGDKFIKGKIDDIKDGRVFYSYNGKQGVLKVQKIPPKPKEIRTVKNKKNREYNW